MSRKGVRRGRYKTRKKRFEYFSGTLKRASLEIIEVAVEHHTQADTIYHVRNLCCGTKSLFTHMTVKARLSAADRNGRGVSKCSLCTLQDSAAMSTKRPRRKCHKVDRAALCWEIDNLWEPPKMALEIHRKGEWAPR